MSSEYKDGKGDYYLASRVVSYVLNKRSQVIHKLPADERCNTDQIIKEQRFEVHASESVVGYLDSGTIFRRCKRCFPDAD